MEFYKALKEPIGMLHFGGTEAATQWCGYMEGAISSGNRAAEEVILRLQNVQDWKKIIDQKYNNDTKLPPKKWFS
jgi:hypothetical protein